MRSFLFAILLLAVAVPARAQVLIGYLFGEKLASKTFNMGFEVGMNFSDMDGLGDSERLNRPVFGLFADWRFSEHLHFGGAVLPIAGRGASGLAPVVTGDPAFDAQTMNAAMERSLNYVEIPLILKYAPKREEGFRVGAGPSLGFITGAHDRYDVGSYVLERDIDTPSLDFGISGEVEWRFKVLAIAARYTEGLTDLGNDTHSRVLTGTGRIYLGKKPD